MIDLPGERISEDFLITKKAKDFLRYVQSVEGTYVKFIESRQKKDTPADVLIIELGVERPQKISNDIRKTECLAIVFDTEDTYSPEVLALREDFPIVPHLNLRPLGYPKSLCLFEEPYDVIKLSWTPSGFLKQIQNWLNKTVRGILHEYDQALEPFMLSSPVRLILPHSYDLSESRLINVFKIVDEDYLTLVLGPENNAKESQFITIGFKLPTALHGIIRYCPNNLQELRDVLSEISFDLDSEIIKFLKQSQSSQSYLNKKMILLFVFSMVRVTDSEVERIDYRAFISSKSLKEIGIEYGIFDEIKDSSFTAPGLIIGETKIKNLSTIDLAPVQIQDTLNAEDAALYNGVPLCNPKITAIGLGALGSQVINNLIRSGFGRWKLIDEDVFLPHNEARHILNNFCIGLSKVNACRCTFNSIIDEPLIDDVICTNILNPLQDKKDRTLKMLKESDLIFDFSASIAVSRYLAISDDFPRSISAYLSPDGKSLVVAAEDESRNIKLAWLEMLHYRAVINNEDLFESLNNPKYHRYGNSCRDRSVILSQDDFSIWSGFTSKLIKELINQKHSSLHIFYQNEFNIQTLNPEIYDIVKLSAPSFNLVFDNYIVDKMSEFRLHSLPNETGGVIVGHIDTYKDICYIVDVFDSPLDSEERPESYVRGFSGLAAQVKKAEERSLGQIRYIGEWHSHPDKCSLMPSVDDLKAYSWLKREMGNECLAAIMFIAGENRTVNVIEAGTYSHN